MFNKYVPEAQFPTFRRSVIRRGGAIVMSAPAVGGFHVTYVSKVGA